MAGQQHCRLCYPSKPSTAHPQQVVVETQMSDHLSVLSPTISLTTLRAGRVVLSTVERQGKARQDVPFRRRSVASTRGVSSGQSCSVSIAAHRPGYHSCTAPLQSNRDYCSAVNIHQGSFRLHIHSLKFLTEPKQEDTCTSRMSTPMNRMKSSQQCACKSYRRTVCKLTPANHADEQILLRPVFSLYEEGPACL